ncbi:oxidoreductase [Dictyobacter alpinus]|uniref:Oxidoreductase n=1 Tax=Dictyobacter alpinus TaxID=2014873 RepID=A0A402B9Y0_9CHLR|nr:SDR family oxidoreductase [Dictyobacter alpinus]GCE28178.1 oxidoreductase [Dictyobacter alpinus]
MDLKNKVAIITGGGQGIGRAIALAFADAGAKVVLASRNKENLEETQRLIQAQNQEALVLPTDVRNAQSIQALVEKTVQTYDHIDTVVFNSGIAGPTAPLWEIHPEQWDEVLSTNLTGAFLLCSAALPSMLAREQGSIIFIGSGTGKHPLPGRTPYAASKIALVGLARTLAHDVGPKNIRVNVISPGPVEGERLQHVFEKQAALRKVSIDAVRSMATRDTALKRFIQADDVANVATFLASDEAQSITGEDINVSAGLVMV